jgi:hypothetical protein
MYDEDVVAVNRINSIVDRYFLLSAMSSQLVLGFLEAEE